MLELLSGTTHIVITGVALVHKQAGIMRSTRVMSAVKMKMLTAGEIQRYVESGDWQGKAGGYGIQDERADPFVTRMAGSHTNIVGLPMEKTKQLLASVGIHPTRPAREAQATATPPPPEPTPATNDEPAPTTSPEDSPAPPPTVPPARQEW
jgi:hypothetical protein